MYHRPREGFVSSGFCRKQVFVGVAQSRGLKKPSLGRYYFVFALISFHIFNRSRINSVSRAHGGSRGRANTLRNDGTSFALRATRPSRGSDDRENGGPVSSWSCWI